jgi:hypothetical protein
MYPAPAPRKNRWLVPVVVVVVVIVVIIAAVFALGLFKGSSNSGTGSGGSTPDFAAAQSAAASSANGQSGGPWKFYTAIGAAPSFAESANINTSFFPTGSSCSSIHLDVANNSAVTVNAFGGSLSSGQASAWIFLYAGSSGLLAIVDNGGNTYPLATANCAAVGTLYSAISPLPSGASSASAAATAWAHGGSAFAAAHPSTSEDFLLSAGFSYLGYGTGSDWLVSFDACTASDASSGASAPSIQITVNATTNAFSSATNGTSSCGLRSSGGGSPGGGNGGGGGPTTLADDLGFGTPSLQTASGLYNETFAVTKANGGLTWGNVSFIYVNVTITQLLSVGYVNVTSGGGAVASFDLGTDSWSSGSTAAIAVGQTVTVTFGSQNPTGGGWACTFFSSSPAGEVTVRFA